jgi:uncharacterized lipoprotein YddW (UPF0748 family)
MNKAALMILFLSVATQSVAQKRDFRGAWIATVANIDWPSKPGLPSDQQQAEYRALLDRLQYAGMNAVIVQVRPAADAFYASALEPWSEWLSGTKGVAPEPYYDPLMYMIEEAHDRGMEFHAWFNPYRAVFKVNTLIFDSTDITIRQPGWFVQYGDKKYFDPGIPEVRNFVTNVISDVVRRYDVDAIHFDDYFYPYRIANLEFPDSVSFREYGGIFYPDRKDDWRRENVNIVIKMLYDSIKAEKPFVKFGISPFGVWRNQAVDPRGSATRAGQTNYDDLFADVLHWMQKGWLDYLVPQIYWPIGFELADYSILAAWWNEHAYGKHIYIGEGAYRIDPDSPTPAWRNPSELPNHLRYADQFENILGHVYFSAKSLVKNPLGFTDILHNEFYKHPALVPTMPWIDQEPPLPPVKLSAQNVHDGVYLQWEDVSNEKPSYYLVYRFDRWKNIDQQDPEFILKLVRTGDLAYLDNTAISGKRYYYSVTAVDRLWNESTASVPFEIKFRDPDRKKHFLFF